MKKFAFSFLVPHDPENHFSLEFDERGKLKPEQIEIEVEAENKLEARKKAEAEFKERYPDA